MKSVAELERELRQAKERDRLLKVQCSNCDGRGWVNDTTYDRCGVEATCGRCHGTGLPLDQVSRIVAEAMAPHRKPAPSTTTKSGGAALAGGDHD